MVAVGEGVKVRVFVGVRVSVGVNVCEGVAVAVRVGVGVLVLGAAGTEAETDRLVRTVDRISTIPTSSAVRRETKAIIERFIFILLWR